MWTTACSTRPSVPYGDIRGWRSRTDLKGLEPAFEFLERADLATLADGRHPIAGGDVYAMISTLQTKAPETGKFETHRKYIDVHALISGEETIGSAPASSLEVSDPYDEKAEAELFLIPARYEKIEMRPGRFAVFVPGAAHLPGCHSGGPQTIRKVVVKVAAAFREQRLAG
jgi:biofilm protein TabA